MEINFKPLPKQWEAYQKLTDKTTKFVLFGGAGGGGKTYGGCAWLFQMCLAYPGTRWFIGRNELKRLMTTTYPSLLKVFKDHKFPISNWKLNGQYNYGEFPNGSRIDFLDLKYLPSDPLYERLGSYEFTGGWIEEAGETNFGAFDVLKSRIGRHMNTEYNLYPKMYLTCNPKKNWLYSLFYKPSIEGTLPKDYVFIPALYKDNLYTRDLYYQTLSSITDPSLKQRLMFGNWEYDEDPAKLCNFDAIQDLFTNEHIRETGEKYLSSDPAMQGRDKFVTITWDGLVGRINWKTKLPPEQAGKIIADDINQACITEKIPHSKCVVDSDGLGNYLASYVQNIKTYHGGAQAKSPKQYANLRSECGFKLAELVNARKIRLICPDPKVKNWIIEELEQLKRDKIDNDETKLRIVKKEDMKENLQRSPDFLDTLMMRMYFELPRGNISVFTKGLSLPK